jgi:hypothetical protein
MSISRYPLLLAVLVLSYANTALPSQKQVDVDTKASATDIQAWLDSEDPRLVAWGAYFAAKAADSVATEKMLQLVARWAAPPRNDPWWARQKIRGMAAVLDCLIQGNVKVPLESVAAIAASFPLEAAFLASRYPIEEIKPLLLKWYEGRDRAEAALLARLAAMMLSQSPPPGFAASVVAEARESIVLSATNVRRGEDLGSVGHICPGNLKRPAWNEWPPEYWYLAEENHQREGSVLLVEAGGDRITYTRGPADTGWGWSQCAFPEGLSGVARHHLLAALLGVDWTAMPWRTPRRISIPWQNGEQWQSELANLIAAEETRLQATVEALHAKNLLTETEAASVRPKLSIAISDDRGSMRIPLTAPVLRDPRTVVTFQTGPDAGERK